MKLSAVILSLTIGLLLVPLGAEARNKDMERLYLQVAALQTEIAQLRSAVDDSLRELRRLNESLAEQAVTVNKGMQDQRVQNESVQMTLKELSDNLAGVRERVRSFAGSSLTVPTAQVAMAPGQEGASEPGAAPPGAAPVPAAMQPAPAELYSQAYADYARGNYDLAIQGFQEYLRMNPNGHLSDNAQFWIGMCLYGKQQYSDAVGAFDELLRQYPGTDKIPDTRFKKAQSLERLGRRSQALLEYRYVFEHFPNTEAGRLAREKVQAR
jgi:tol-pal system protein YbgF